MRDFWLLGCRISALKFQERGIMPSKPKCSYIIELAARHTSQLGHICCKLSRVLEGEPEELLEFEDRGTVIHVEYGTDLSIVKAKMRRRCIGIVHCRWGQ